MKDAQQNYYFENGEYKETKGYTVEDNKKTVYEVIKIIKGRPLFYEDHYKRMVNSCRLASMKMKYSEEDLKNYIIKLAKKNNIMQGNVKITYTDKYFRIFFIKHSYPTEEMYKDGVHTILSFKERTNPNAKIVNNDFRSAVNEEIRKANAFEAILVSRNGNITEGSKSNIFLIKDKTLYTSKVEAVLPGVTRTEIIKTARENNIKVVEEDINYKNLSEYDALFISGTSPDILPINTVGEKKYDINNETLRQLMDIFGIKIQEYIG